MTSVTTSRIQSSETTIDHIGLVGRDIHAMVATFRNMGFLVTDPAPLTQPGPDGEPVPLGQLSAHVIFPDSYLELTAIEHPGQGNHLDPWLARHEGLHIVAFRTADAKQSWDDLAAYGVVMPPLRAASREVNAGGVTGIADFKWFQIPESIAREGFACVVEHQTPELVFIKSMMGHENGATGLRGVGALVDDLDEAAGRYQRLPGADVVPFALGRFVVLKDQRFVAMKPGGMAALCPGVKLPAPPCFAAFAVQVKNVAETRATLTKKGVPFQVAGEQSIWVKPEHACGAVLLFLDESAPI
ncbi:MAG: VOC family protein [Rhodospirillaceae bacterium]|nr:VOC family protein [Rhodospirillaceae bacterium]